MTSLQSVIGSKTTQGNALRQLPGACTWMAACFRMVACPAQAHSATWRADEFLQVEVASLPRVVNP